MTIDKVVAWDYERIRDDDRDRILIPRLYISHVLYEGEEFPFHVYLDLNDSAYLIQKCKTQESANDFIRRFTADLTEELDALWVKQTF